VKRPSYSQRQAEAKRKADAKRRAVANVCAVVERLWSTSVAPGNDFTEQERQSIADAQHSLRGIQGGWINYRKVRL
jgi:hypothetical protein